MNAYELLECQPNATQEELKIAYHRLLLIYHPDKSDKAIEQNDCIEKFLKIQSAYKLLSNLEQRKEYDSLIKQMDLKQKAACLESGDILHLGRDFEFDNDLNLFKLECRCGSFYLLSKIDLNNLMESSLSDSSSDLLNSQTLLVSLYCDSCSLHVNVLII
jgi:diphthamide biosynthesis protein 4